MTFPTRGYAAQSATTPLAPFQFERRAARPDDVVIDVLYCGVCHSDIHQARNEWNSSTFPMVPGHEIVGRVSAVGSEVTKFKVGDTVGVGCMVDSCQHCASCHAGLEQYCEQGATWTYNDKDRQDGSLTFGGYSERVVVSDKFVVSISDKLDLKAAAPLLCAGITTWSPLRHWNVRKGSKVAVIGLGGLGHMGLKFAKAMGADVTLFTRSPGKEEEARRLGADHVVLSTDEQQMAAVARQFEFILDTVPNPHDLNPYLNTLAINGVLCLVGQLQPLDPPVNAAQVLLGRRSISGSAIGGIAETQEMLDFCAEHNIVSDIEVIDMKDINAAYERVIKSDVRYRFVIDIASLKAA
ncbi:MULTISPECIES: NAD(P)-dependent alcohol dehydrogenase [unclassified Dyella]|uniref:NAD(P)-dependent alcohol dehydrogenase n=1 Tax=unclassified Dyella TaxID=2634549 RepID=UPI000C85DB89|nr:MULTISPECIES: NAD(P)-dependent alcohol dehydrogenase [unclassified Dyella]MDR3445486.1 NAD(P)-dependent alcohol dehydrogenase [Dyella sp.]PMQ05288.1 putative formaldehyde dehydrogenase AdhA [Dyella sp. AD56]